MSTVLSDKDANQAVVAREEAPAGDKTKSLEYHRQVLQSKMESEKSVPLPFPATRRGPPGPRPRAPIHWLKEGPKLTTSDAGSTHSTCLLRTTS